jgi:Carbohydrate binding module (family 35)
MALVAVGASLGIVGAQDKPLAPSPASTPIARERNPSGAEPGALIVSGPQRVQDTTLRDGKYWGKWNFGGSQYLQIGVQPSTVYDIYRSVTLIRFDVSGLPYTNVDSAKLRLYIPRDLIQQVPVPIRVYAVSPANGNWKAGASEAKAQPDACSWDNLANGRPWAGEPGLSRPGIDYSAQPLDTKTVDGLNGEWIQLELPKRLVQSWMDKPDQNAGLLIKTDDNAQPGQSTYICSSEHWSDRGPQLVVMAEGVARTTPSCADTGIHCNKRFEFPPMGPVYHRWLQQSPSRYAAWVKDKSIHLTGIQAEFPYLWDILVRGQIILPEAILPLSGETEEIPAVIARGDRNRARQIMEDFMKDMMVFDYARDQNWYDSGPVVDVLSPLQVAKFFVKSDTEGSDNGVHAIYSQYDDGRWNESSTNSESVDSDVEAQLATIQKRLNPSPAQRAVIESVLRRNMPLEKLHARELKKSLDRVRELIDRGVDGVEMLRALRSMFYHHRMFLIHQSLFSMPKYSVLMDNGDILAYAKWFYDVRHGQYSHDRVGRQLAAATRYMWKPSEHHEAEYGSFQGCDWANAIPGYSGTGYVVFDDRPQSQIEWRIPITAEGTYRLAFRYSLPGGLDKQLQLAVGRTICSAPLCFSSTDTWATNAVTLALHPGENIISLTTLGNGGPNLDYLDVEPSKVAESKKSPAEAFINPEDVARFVGADKEIHGGQSP